MTLNRYFHKNRLRFARKIQCSTKLVISISFLLCAIIKMGKRSPYRIICNDKGNIALPISAVERSSIELLTFTSSEKSQFLAKVGHLCTPKEKNSNLAFIKYSQIENSKERIVSKILMEDIWAFCAMATGFSHGVISNQVKIVDEGFLTAITNSTNHAIMYHDIKSNVNTIHAGFLMLGHTQAGRRVSRRFLLSLIEHCDTFHEDSSNEFNYDTWKGIKLYQLIMDEFAKNSLQWSIHTLACVGLQLDYFYNIYVFNGKCSRIVNGPCCQVDNESEEVVMLTQDALELIHDEDSKYYGSIQASVTAKEPIWNAAETCSNCVRWTRMFDMMADNDCLPSYACHVCLTKQSYALDFKSQCKRCGYVCGCYCKVLCHMRPEQKRSVKEYFVQIPSFRTSNFRLIPRIIHQTYFEEITENKYPNFSRLVSSWKYSGWDYRFYDNDASAKFLDIHFPPEVREAYEILAPGAYKADLFRYCVLLIHGGIYADVDVMLNLDLNKIDDDIGFIVPVDEPGRSEGVGSCLWNGFIAAAPGHPFIAKVIEMVINIVRNRYTAVDIDDMLCPRPNLGHSHDWDLLFITGPCVLGAAINSILGKDMQSNVEPGELNTIGLYHLIPGRTIILSQNKTDIGMSHRFTWNDKNLIVATTDIPNYEDNPHKRKHYSTSTREMRGIFGLKNVYKDMKSANEELRLEIKL